MDVLRRSLSKQILGCQQACWRHLCVAELLASLASQLEVEAIVKLPFARIPRQLTWADLPSQLVWNAKAKYELQN